MQNSFVAIRFVQVEKKKKRERLKLKSDFNFSHGRIIEER